MDAPDRQNHKSLTMKKVIIYAVILALAIVGALMAHKRIQNLERERDKYQSNSIILMSEVDRYRTKDSLNVAQVQSLQLTIKEFERFRAEDAALIKTLRTKNRDLAAINKAQSATIIEMSAIPRDTVIVMPDSSQIPAIAVHCGDAWYDFDGIVTADAFTGNLECRDSLIIAETVKYKRFLGFLWKTKQVKDRQIDCVPKSPHTTIMGMEHIVIEK